MKDTDRHTNRWREIEREREIRQNTERQRPWSVHIQMLVWIDEVMPVTNQTAKTGGSSPSGGEWERTMQSTALQGLGAIILMMVQLDLVESKVARLSLVATCRHSVKGGSQTKEITSKHQLEGTFKITRTCQEPVQDWYWMRGSH